MLIWLVKHRDISIVIWNMFAFWCFRSTPVSTNPLESWDAVYNMRTILKIKQTVLTAPFILHSGVFELSISSHVPVPTCLKCVAGIKLRTCFQKSIRLMGFHIKYQYHAILFYTSLMLFIYDPMSNNSYNFFVSFLFSSSMVLMLWWASPSQDEHGSQYRHQLQLVLWQQGSEDGEVEDIEE